MVRRLPLPGSARSLRVALLVALSASGCSFAGRGPSPPPGAPVADGWTEEGEASWYGHPFHGRTTASGETYDMNAPTAAHKTLPFGVRVRIDNLDNGRSTTLTVNDRGPFIRGRIIDVSRRGAEELGMVGAGVARVRITVVEAPAPRRCWDVQVGAFSRRDNAEGLRDRLRQDNLDARIETGSNGLHRVLAGPFAERAEAERVRGRWNGVLVGC
jgi:rare lipoprotein A